MANARHQLTLEHGVGMLQRRRLSTVQLVLVSLLLCSSAYLWSKKIHPFRYDSAIVFKSEESSLEESINEVESSPNVVAPLADPSDSEAGPIQEVQLVPEVAEVREVQSCPPATTESADPGVEPFPQFNFDLAGEVDDNRTLEWLDLWRDDANCTQHRVRLLPDDSVPDPGALVSFPGSGNSWLRMLLMGATGIFIRSVYDGDDSLFQSKANSTYRLASDCGCTLLQKTHDFTLDAALYKLHVANRTLVMEQFGRKGVLIIRNPFTAIKSYRNFEYGGMQGKAPENAFAGPEWDNFVSRSIASWETLAHVWIGGLRQGGIIYYERLRRETGKELKRLASVLGLTLDEDRFDCVVRHTADNSFKRNSKSEENPYTASQRLLIHKAIDSVNESLKRRAFDPLPLDLYDYYDVMHEYGVFD